MLNEAYLTELFKPLLAEESLVLAVSGGPDSMALMAMAARWRAGLQGAAPSLMVASVDHGLRTEAAAEITLVADFAAHLRLPHEKLLWVGPKPATGLMERARIARYDLLADAAKRFGASALVTAHHADDQAETILLRLAHGSSITGIAGMRVCDMKSGIRHWRPLLRLQKADLLAYCDRQSIPFSRDPTNLDTRYARAQLRLRAGLMEQMGLDVAALLRLGGRAARADAALEHMTDAFLVQIGFIEPFILRAQNFHLAAHKLLDVPEEIALRALARIMSGLGQWQGYVRLERLERMWLGLQTAIGQGQSFSATLSGAKLALDKKGHLLIQRETPRKHRGTAMKA